MTPSVSTAPEQPAPERSAGPAEAALAAGEQALYGAGDLDAARSWFAVAARDALVHGDIDGLARASLGLGGFWVHEHRTAVVAARVTAWQQHAQKYVEPSSSLAVRLALRLAAETDYARGTYDNVLAALAASRAGDDPTVLAEGLNVVHHCLLAPEHATLRLKLAEELLGVAAITGRRIDETLGLLWRTVDLLLVGDPHAERSLRELIQANNGHRLRAVEFVLSAIDVMRLIRQGDLTTAERLAAACAEQGRAAGDLDALAWYAAHITAIRWFQGRIGELVPLLADQSHSPDLAGPDDSLSAALAVAAATLGDRTQAVTAVRRVVRTGLKDLPRSSTWLVTVAGIIEAAAALGDAQLATDAYDLLEKYADRPVMASLAVVCFGSAHHPLGVAALTIGDLDRAARHFRAAIAANEALAHHPAAALSRERLSEVLALQHRNDGPPTILIRRDSSGWCLERAGRSVSVPDNTGMRYLRTLLDNPGREIEVAQLVGLNSGDKAHAAPLLDEAARTAYRNRVSALQAQITLAQDDGDAARVSRARTELTWLLDEIKRSTGLGGRSRRFADETERARTSAQKAIRRAIDRVGVADAELARELRASVVTGVRCRYLPSERHH